MTDFERFLKTHCTEVEVTDGDVASFLADRFLQIHGMVSDPVTQRRLIDQMRQDGLYFAKDYTGKCRLKLRPYPIDLP